MAPMIEKSPDKVIANIFTNITVQIILLLILLSRVTEAFCWGAPNYKLSFEDRMADDVLGYDMINNIIMTIKCGCTTNFFTDVNLKLNPEASFRFCGGWFSDPTCKCSVALSSLRWYNEFEAFYNGMECKRKRDCRWHIRRNHPYLYDPYQEDYEQRGYFLQLY